MAKRSWVNKWVKRRGKTQKELLELQSSYKAVFDAGHGPDVLEDLMRFCRANETCVVPGDRDATLIAEGRREVILRILDHVNLSPEDLLEEYE